MTSKTILEITIIIAVLVASAAFGGSAMADTACTPSTTTLCLIVDQSSDDAEESSGGSMDLNSSDLDLSESGKQAIRFNNIVLEPNAQIQSVHVIFTSEDNDGGSGANARIQAQIDNPLTFTSANGDISNRPLTNEFVNWSMPEWSDDEIGSDTQTPDLTLMFNEVLTAGNWASGNSMVFVFSELEPQDSDRDAYSFDHSSNDNTKQARLHIVCDGNCTTPPPPSLILADFTASPAILPKVTAPD